MINFDVEQYILGLEDAIIDEDMDPKLKVFKLKVGGEDKIFAIIAKESNPLVVTLKCDPALAKKLRAEYETVMPATNMNKHNWNDILCTGQLSGDDMRDLINLSHHLVVTSQ